MHSPGDPSRDDPGRAGGGPAVWSAVFVALVLAAAVSWLNWPDPATMALAVAVATLAAIVFVQRRAAQRRLRLLRRLQARLDRRAATEGSNAGGEVASSPDSVLSSLSSAADEDSLLSSSWPQGKGRLQVLVAEDHDVNRQLLASLLQALGHDAVFAADGEQAVQAVRERAFDVVLMDLAMPVLDGIAATRAIRALPDSRQAALPIVALTADESPQTRARCLLAGMNDFLTKPISADALAVCLRRLFGDEAAAQGRPAPPQPVGPALIDAATLNAVLVALPRERVAELMQRFFTEAPLTLQRLRRSVRDAQTQDLQVTAHGLRGAALNLGLAALASTAGALHDGASHLAAHEVALLLQRLELQIEQTREALQAMGLGGEAGAAATAATR